MANNNVQNIKFLRNGNLYATREAALTNIEANKGLAADGTAILARYGSGNEVKTIVGFKYTDGTNSSLTIFDTEGASADVEKLRQEINAKLGDGITSANTASDQLAALSGNSSSTSAETSVEGAKRYADELISGLDHGDTAVTGQYVSQVSQADGVISVTRVELPTVAAISETGKPITAVSESLGAISATAGAINAEFVNIADSGEKFTATTVEDAFAEVAAKIEAMDKDADAVAGQVVTTVSEADGVVAETKANVKDLQLGGYTKDTTATGDIASTDTINAALSKLENKAAAITIKNDDGSINVTTGASGTDIKVHIKSGEKVIKKDGNGGIYTDIDLVKITTGLPAEVKERYQLLASDDSQIGVNIDVPKDSHIVSINYITTGEHAQNLEYVYIDASGNTQTTYVDMSELVLEAEFASGVTVTDHVAHGVVDSTSESFLTVGANGFKLSGVQDAIDSAVSGLDATVGSTSVDSDKHVAVQVVEEDGKLTALTVTENDIASASALTQEIADRGTADTELSNRLGNSVTTANTASAQLAALSGTSADGSGVTSVYGAKAYAKDYADEKVATIVDGLDANVSGNSTHITVGVAEENGVITGVTVSESDIASATALTAEIAARKAVDGQNGDTYAANTGSNYISDATSLNDADVKLDIALKAADDAMLTGVTAGNGISVADKSNKSQVISAKVKNDEGIVVDESGLHLGTIDCGIY